MDVAVSWSPSAARDLDEIAAYIAKDSQAYAATFVLHVLRIAGQLAAFPQSGRIVPEHNDSSLRERVVSHYRLIYRLRESEVLILAVIHGRRQLTESFEPTNIE